MAFRLVEDEMEGVEEELSDGEEEDEAFLVVLSCDLYV